LQDFLDRLDREILIGDGAMGTMIYSRGVPLSHSYDELNRSHPELIRQIHAAYLAAGAQAIETNTFTANRNKLARFGLENEVRELNVRGAEIARSVAGQSVYVLGSVGPVRTSEADELSREEMKRFYTEQIEALTEGGVDAIILETFAYLEDLLVALEAQQDASRLPVICQLAVDESAVTRDGVHIQQAFEQLRRRGADIVGVNCAKGPHGVLRALEQVPLEPGLRLSAFPNAGLPAFVDGRYMYLSTPEYFARSALALREQGCRLIGGCCGTTPDHIRAIAQALTDRRPITAKVAPAAPAVEVKAEVRPAPPVEPKLLDLVKQRTTVIVELDPPRDLLYEKVLQGAKVLKGVGADAITMADNSLGVTRMSNVALGYLVKARVGLRPVLHIACRDRNLIGLQSELMGLYALGIDHVLALTGDPAKFGDQPGATSVYDLNSFTLVRMIRQLNSGVSFSGKPLQQKTNFTIGVAFNANVNKIETQVSRLRKKIEMGADFVMTQPIFDPAKAKIIYEATKSFSIPIFVGVMPLVSGRNADFLHNEVPGIEIPEAIRQRMWRYEGEQARQEGLAVAKELVDAVLEHFNGLYLITPFLRYEMTAELVEYARRR